MQMQRGAVNVVVVTDYIEITVSCQCGRNSSINALDLPRFCQYCGTSFASQDIDLPAILAEAKAEQDKQLERRTAMWLREKEADRYFWRMWYVPIPILLILMLFLAVPALHAFGVALPFNYETVRPVYDALTLFMRNYPSVVAVAVMLLAFGSLFGWVRVCFHLKRRKFPELYQN